MRIIFRADASKLIGAGHVMRSSVLAEEAIARGHECIFIGQIYDLDWVKIRVSGLGFTKILADDENFESDANSDVLILDSYSVDPSSDFISQKNWKCVLTICDEMTPNYKASIELRPSLDSKTFSETERRILSGPKYTLTRAGMEKSKHSFENDGKLRILILGGGSDPFGFVPAMALQVSSLVSSLGLNADVHCFSNSENFNFCGSNFFVHKIGNELDLWAGCVDLALTPASTSSLELIAREVPVGVVCAIDNQRELYDQLGRLGYASQIGFLSVKGRWEFKEEELKNLLIKSVQRDSLREKIHGLIDFNGASRVIDFLEHSVAQTNK